jgi:hypothetical protein
VVQFNPSQSLAALSKEQPHILLYLCQTMKPEIQKKHISDDKPQQSCIIYKINQKLYHSLVNIMTKTGKLNSSSHIHLLRFEILHGLVVNVHVLLLLCEVAMKIKAAI